MTFKKGEPSANPHGRPKGSHREPRLSAAQRREMVRKAGMTPAEYLLSVMADVNERSFMRSQAAIALLPYMHRRLPTAVEVSQPGAFGLDPGAIMAMAPERRRLLLDLLGDMGITAGPGPATERALSLSVDNMMQQLSDEDGA